MDDVLEHAKQVIKTYELADKHPNSLIFGNNYMAALIHAPEIAHALIETQKRLDEAIRALERIEGNWQQVKSIKGNGHEPSFLTVVVSKGGG